MTEKVTSLSEKTNDATLDSPLMLLKRCLSDVQDKDKEHAFAKGKKLLVLALDESDGHYNVNFQQCGMKMSECIALCKIAETIFLTEMEFIPDDRDY